MQFASKLMGGWLLLGVGLASSEAASTPGNAASSKTNGAHGEISYEKQVTPLLTKYCYGCHGNGKSKGDLALDAYKTAAEAANDSKTWEKVLNNLHTHVMPP